MQSILGMAAFIFAVFCVLAADKVTGNAQPVENCIVIVGDSIPHGTAVFEVPGHGFPVIQTRPFSFFLHDVLQSIHALYVGVYDLSAPATALTGESPYAATPQYAMALTRSCRFVVIFPWLIELRSLNLDPERSYIDHLVELVGAFQAASPQSQIVVMNYYPVVTTTLGDTIYGGSVTQESVTLVNQMLSEACAGGVLAGVSCMDISGLFLDGSHVFTSLSQEQYVTAAYSPVNVEDTTMLELFWAEQPEGVILGDGVHLNAQGKAQLAEALVVFLYELDPGAFTLLQFE